MDCLAAIILSILLLLQYLQNFIEIFEYLQKFIKNIKTWPPAKTISTNLQ